MATDRAVAIANRTAAILLAVAACAGSWALFMRLAPELDFALILFVSIGVGLVVETAASSLLKRRRDDDDDER